ncbi:hypothetical protein L198_06767 [Cryptococcus wingfieldii CBS 7118]|uniref:Xylanolytic transcriptional activator regulatory domain-containing protein n=1 Tax=Cryptococcus wingfieldii CBS 7118 TaxID=1295528 RepID=A0A1E3IJ72_9TREE|nr:hypothetical protein L198_06767 [Cryptococcus wingfieldii CBS 7118]ODN88495.1 hypothetical protein L198_06767 [Cryptococcus wingfieldii CBS 7118]
MGYTSEGSGEGSDKRVKRRAPKKSPSVVRRACDACRRKKVRCEGPMNSLTNAKCAQCDHFGVNARVWKKHLGARIQQNRGYDRMLEQRCSRLEMMLQEVYPDVNLDDYVGPPLDFEDFDLDSYQEELRAFSIPGYPSLKPLHPVPSPLPASPSSPEPSNALIDSVSFIRESDRGKSLDEIEHTGDDSVVVVNSLRRLQYQHVRWRHHGRTSGSHLVRHYQDLKQDAGESGNIFEKLSKDKREDFWQVPEWEQFVSDVGQNALDYLIWPENGLDQQLINAYFETFPSSIGISFRRSTTRACGKASRGLGVATGTFWPRGLSATQGQNRDYDEQWLPYSAGWKYLRMALHMGHNPLYMPDLHELQSQVLICYFLQSSTTPQMSAHLAGSALSSSQEIGIHLTTVLERLEPTERELFKRAFWCLYHFDRFSCAMVGRSVAMTDNDQDAPFPEDPEGKGKVSKVAMFIQLLKLDQILGKVLYSSRQEGSRQATRRTSAIELDLALEEWADNVPEALRWDPNCSNFTIFQQTSCIWGYHGFVKMLIHRKFIPPKRKVGTIDQLSSLTSISKAVLQRGRQEDCQPGHCLDVSFRLLSWLAGTILPVSIYTVEQTAIERQAAEDGIRACLAASRELEIIWKQGGKFLKETETPNPRRLGDGSGGDPKGPKESMYFTPSTETRGVCLGGTELYKP